jgi:hypothetical protein
MLFGVVGVIGFDTCRNGDTGLLYRIVSVMGCATPMGGAARCKDELPLGVLSASSMSGRPSPIPSNVEPPNAGSEPSRIVRPSRGERAGVSIGLEGR